MYCKARCWTGESSVLRGAVNRAFDHPSNPSPSFPPPLPSLLHAYPQISTAQMSRAWRMPLNAAELDALLTFRSHVRDPIDIISTLNGGGTQNSREREKEIILEPPPHFHNLTLPCVPLFSLLILPFYIHSYAGFV